MGKLIAILNADKEFGIGKNGSLLFRLPKDMAFFKEKTMGHTVAMGENTLLSFPKQSPLKGRMNVVLSKDGEHEGCINVHSLEELRKTIDESLKKDDVYVVGGASIYRQMLPYVDEILLTRVDEIGGADVFFPDVDSDENFELAFVGEPIDDNGHTIRFTTYKNLNKKDL